MFQAAMQEVFRILVIDEGSEPTNLLHEGQNFICRPSGRVPRVEVIALSPGVPVWSANIPDVDRLPSVLHHKVDGRTSTQGASRRHNRFSTSEVF